MGRHIREGLRYAWGRGWMLAVLAALGLATFFGYSCTVLYPALALDVLDRGRAPTASSSPAPGRARPPGLPW